MTDFDGRQADRRAAGKVGTAALLGSLPAGELRSYAEWILAAPDPTAAAPGDAVRAAAAIRRALGEVRMLNARRELAEIGAFLVDAPDSPHAPHYRERFAELTRYVLALERSGLVSSRPWGQLVNRETRPPARRGLAWVDGNTAHWEGSSGDNLAERADRFRRGGARGGGRGGGGVRPGPARGGRGG